MKMIFRSKWLISPADDKTGTPAKWGHATLQSRRGQVRGKTALRYLRRQKVALMKSMEHLRGDNRPFIGSSYPV